MKTSLIVLVIFALSIATNFVFALNETQKSFLCDRNKWNLFKLEFGKNYDSASEDALRFARFCKNFQKIILHNENRAATYEMAVNQFSDMSTEERNSITNGFLGLANIKTINNLNDLMNLTDKDVPDFVDWSKDDRRVSRVRNQRFCGSCWAFSLIGLLEGQQKPTGRDKLIPLSEQNLIDCNKLNYGCSGGLLMDSLEDIKRMGGLMSLADYPYSSGWRPSKKQICKMDRAKIVASTKNLGQVRSLPYGNEEVLKRVVANYGPVAIGYHSTENFQNYNKGVFYEEQCPKSGNHAMLIVGYGTDSSGQDYWKLKNSWGGSSWNPFNKWGQRGFGLVARNLDNNCGIASHAVIIGSYNGV